MASVVSHIGNAGVPNTITSLPFCNELLDTGIRDLESTIDIKSGTLHKYSLSQNNMMFSFL